MQKLQVDCWVRDFAWVYWYPLDEIKLPAWQNRNKAEKVEDGVCVGEGASLHWHQTVHVLGSGPLWDGSLLAPALPDEAVTFSLDLPVILQHPAFS